MRAIGLSLLLVSSLFLAGCGANATDSDGDGLRDGTERKWPPIIVDLIDRRIQLNVTSDGNVVDTDGDGLSDFDEFFRKTNPRNPDTDEDGLTDCQEAVHSVASECADPDFAGDYDTGTGTNPSRADSDPGPSRYISGEGRFTDETGTLPNGPEWGDGIPDGEEIAGFTVDLGSGRSRHVTTNPRDTDSDDDALEDGEERFLFSSDPSVQDTDGDQCIDGGDPWPNKEERLSLGLQTFFLKVDKDTTGGSDLVLSGQIAGEVFVTPASGSRHVNKDEATDISAMTPTPKAPRLCQVSAIHPWAVLQIAANDPDSTGGQAIDFYSASGAPSGAIPSLHWNLRTGEFAWNVAASQRVATPITLEGADARLSFLPTVVFPQVS